MAVKLSNVAGQSDGTNRQTDSDNPNNQKQLQSPTVCRQALRRNTAWGKGLGMGIA
ncbi:hypothetical protein PHLCEN_2v9867 [Hermanssonia centrifuga]|uniref:Uncharacterized protein n=1 Tax=Hermanssonia centrifuga TaxID=98765 RepID=A0A2R6NPD8_9APHY|nr:hypothetical protein PHLCEN_2v9867 [Hermanssonia centrifuga]